MYLTQGGSVQMLLTSGPRWCPAGQTPLSANLTLQPLMGQLHGDTLQEQVTGNPKPNVGGGQTPWLPGHVARPAGHHIVSYQLNQVGYPSLDPYKYPLPVEIKTPHSSCSSPLVKVSV
jgi:hypothetical protein